MTQIDLDEYVLFAIEGDYAVGSWLDDAWKSVKKVVKSPITKAIVGGVAIVFPPVGVPAAAALVAADITVRATESKDPKVRAEAKKLIDNTAKLAKEGDPGAQAAIKILTVVADMRKKAKAIAAAGGTPRYNLYGGVVDVGPAKKKPAAKPAAKVSPAAAASAAAATRATSAGAAARAKIAAVPAGWIRSAEGMYKRAS